MQMYTEIGRSRLGNNSLWKPKDLLPSMNFKLYWGFAFLQLLDVTNIRVHKFAHGAWLLVKVIGNCRLNSPACMTICL